MIPHFVRDDVGSYQFYSLDVILAVGYRTNSKKAIAFRHRSYLSIIIG
ncbi:MAG: hypothetical protein B7X00_00245 [Legionella sp. 21-45-4]|nr:MAG: hypothetical protein B7X00_00245 [Legionella sp. 21-45-4]